MHLFSFSQEVITSLHGINENIAQESKKLITQKDIHYFKKLVKVHQSLNLEYSIFCTQLAHKYSVNGNSIGNNAELMRQIAIASAMTELLAHVYHHYLIVPREVERLQNEQKIYQTLLTSVLSVAKNSKNTGILFCCLPTSQTIRKNTATYNIPRLFLGRIRLFLINLSPLTPDWQNFHHYIQSIDKFAKPFFSHLSWAFYTPRLLINTAILLKHSISGQWLQGKEKELGWITRAQAHFERRWFELGNDIAWLIVGLCNCFLLIGVLTPIARYLNVTFLVFDVSMVCLRSLIEFRQLQQLKNQYEENFPSEIIRHSLAQHQKFAVKKLILNIFNTMGILLAGTIMTFIMIHPLIPLLSASIMITVTLLSYMGNKILEKQKPVDKFNLEDNKNGSLSASSNHLFFSANNWPKNNPISTRSTLTAP